MKYPAFWASALMALTTTAMAVPVPVTLDPAMGLTRGGKPYQVKGVGGQTRLPQLASLGANSIRTWSTTDLDQILDSAQQHGLTVSAGIWLESECAWFSYRNAEHCAKQTARVKAEIQRFREHPALLAWGLGNEAEGDGADPAFWQQIGRLAAMVKEVDPAHPTFTAVAGITTAKAAGLNQHAPQLDYLGVNTYGGLFSLRKTLAEVKWTRPWLVTEWGPQGFWERPKGAGGMALEQTSTEKANMMERAYLEVIAPGGTCLGSYAFVWGWKYEGTTTWFGLLTHDGHTTASVDVLQQQWSGQRPANTAPAIFPLSGVPNSPVAPGTSFTASTQATDPESDSLTWHWTVLPEAAGHDAKATPAMPPSVPDTITDNSQPGKVTVSAPRRPGRYRLHLQISDGHGHAATANAPLVVQ